MPQPQDALQRSRRPCEVLAESEDKTCNFKHPILANWARVPNPPDRAAPGLHPNRRAAMPEIDGNRPHTMHAEPIGAGETAPDVGTGAL